MRWSTSTSSWPSAAMSLCSFLCCLRTVDLVTRGQLRSSVMHLQPSSSWYLFDVGDAPSVRLLTVEGRADPALSARPHARLAALAEAIHATAYHLTETELGSLRGQGSLRGR